jgi:ABC-2 type transport system ATP-binding protein
MKRDVFMSLIEIKGVSKSFKKVQIFENLNMSFEKGGMYGIVGPNGCGKSVLFKLICGFFLPDSGTIEIEGKMLNKNNRFPTNFGIIIDRPGYIDDKTGFENLKYLAMIQNKIRDEQIIKTMEKLGLDPKSKTKVKSYSLGMKQKLALCQAIMEEQEVLILDEPFNALDESSVETVRGIILNLHKEGKTIILTSHNQEDIDLLCKTVYRVNNYNLEKV